MSTISKSLTTGNYELNITPTTSDQTTTLKVGGTYCDTDIDVKTSAVTNASGFSLDITNQSNTNITVGSKVSSYYQLTTSLTGTFSASTPGYFSSGSATDSSVIVGRIAAAGYSVATSSYTNRTTITPSASAQYVRITAGYTPNSKITINAAPSATASMPSTLSGSSATVSVSNGTVTLVKSLTNAATITTAGWLSSLSGTTEITLSGTLEAILTINGTSPDSNGNAQITSIGATTSDTMPSSLVQYGNFLKLVKVRS